MIAAALFVTGCPDDEASSSDIEGAGGSSSDDGSSTAPPVTTDATPGTTDDSTGTSSTGGTTTPDDGTSTSTDDGDTSTGSDTGSDSSSSSSDSESESSGSESSSSTGSMSACVDEDLGSAIPTTVNGDTTAADDDVAISCGFGGADGHDLVYRFTAPAAGTYIVDTEGSAIDTILAVYDDCGGSEIGCSEDGPGEIDCGGFACSRIVLALAQDESVVLVVDGHGAGAITLNVDEAPPPPATGYGDCLDTAGAACQPGEECINAVDPGVIAVCAYDTCADASGCPPAPATGDAVVACIDITGSGSPNCVLDCTSGETCPDGLACHLGICVAEAPPHGGTCCDDTTGGVPGTGSPGCDTTAYAYCVCELIGNDEFCCTTEWDAMCAAFAVEQCGATCL